jgi:hypothetical protein
MTIRTYFWTIAGSWSNSAEGYRMEYETHYTAAVSGPIRDSRRKLGLRSAKHHQLMLFSKFGKFVRLKYIKARFEREARANKVDREIPVKARTMKYSGKKWEATQYPDTSIRLRPSKDERILLKILRDLEKMAKDREARLKENRALKKRLWKELVENAEKKLKAAERNGTKDRQGLPHRLSA